MSVEEALCGITLFGAAILGVVVWQVAKDAREAKAALDETARADEAR